MNHTSNMSGINHTKLRDSVLEQVKTRFRKLLLHYLTWLCSYRHTYRQFSVNQQGFGLNNLDVIHFKELRSLEIREFRIVSA